MTMALTREDISGSNPVRTFSLAGEGLMVGGPFGVLMIAIGFSLIASYIHRYLAQREELKILQYYFTLLATCAFRTSLFTFFVGNVVLTLVPVAIVYGILLVTFGLKAKIARTNSPVQSHSARPQLLT